MSNHDELDVSSATETDSLGRRDALKKMGIFAAYTTPMVVGVLTSKKSMAASHGNNGFGNGGSDGVPGNSNKSDSNR